MRPRPSSLRSALDRTGEVGGLLIKHVIIWAVQALVLTALAGIIPGIVVHDYTDAFLVIMVVAALSTTVMPVLYRVAVRLTPVLYPIVTFLIFAWTLLLIQRVLPGWQIATWWDAGITAAVLTTVSAFLGSFLTLSDDGPWRRYALNPVRARYGQKEADASAEPGFIFLEVDGLSEPILRQAMETGYAPVMARWLAEGSHQLSAWECDLSSQTSAMQAGILFGSNDDIPAFRWYDRQKKRVIVSNNPRDAAIVEAERSSGTGLLANDGASRGNMFSGDASDSLFTFSTLLNSRPGTSRHYVLFYSNLYNLSRTLALYVADVVYELAATTWQLLRNERPRVRRFGIYPFVRAATTSVLRELSTFTVASDMLRGVPVVYTTYVAYDEVAHHSGIARGDAMRVLRTIDRDIGRLERVARETARPYYLVVLSDHGQTQGATFHQRYGESLSDLVQRSLGHHEGRRAAEVFEPPAMDEGSQMVGVLIADFLKANPGEHPIMERALRRARIPGRERDLPPEVGHNGRVLVLASGNLGTVTFTGLEERQTLEAITVLQPALVPTLVGHPGIAFALLETEHGGPIVIGPGGFRMLTNDMVQGVDPLAAYGPHVAEHLRRWNGFRNAADILVISKWWPETDDVAAFEELVGSHGGLGGNQNRPFLLSPVDLSLGPEPLVGAPALYRLFKGWLETPPVRSGGQEP